MSKTLTKICTTCNIEKSLDQYWALITGKYGKRARCIPCTQISKKEYRKKNKDKLNNYSREYNKKNWEYLYQKQKEYWAARPEEYKEKERNHTKNRRQDPIKKIACNIRTRISTLLRQNKINSSIESLGCSLNELKDYLSQKFQENMTWNNYGKWHVDHIKPLSSFNLLDKNQFLLACHYTNLQPLWASDNIRKGNKI